MKERRALAGLAALRMLFDWLVVALRATGITDYLKSSDGDLTKAREMANHADTRTTQLYDRRAQVAAIGEYEKVGI